VLRKSGNKHANGAMYLGGFVFECLLKARLMECYPWLQSAGSAEGRTRDESYLWSLCYRSHDLDEILARLPEIRKRLSEFDQRTSQRLWQNLTNICGTWTIYARYSPESATMQEAEVFLESVKDLKKWLR
jgi:hypothetical protein